MQLVIFDIDGTLVRGSSERLFWRYLWARKRQGPRQLLAFLAFFVRYLPIGGIHTSKKNKAYLTGFEAAEVEQLAADFVAVDLTRALYEPALTRLKAHLKRGDLVLLMSGTLQPIARALGDALGVEHVLATLCAESRGRLRAWPPARHPFGSAKVAFAREFAHQHGFDLGTVVAYSDSRDDIELLEAVGVPVIVRPDRTLLARALERNWELLSAKGTSASPPAYQ
jgi:HAD superfamily hydrolase (TIGR01490 family)